jgi:hypothetical protein
MKRTAITLQDRDLSDSGGNITRDGNIVDTWRFLCFWFIFARRTGRNKYAYFRVM